MGKLLTIKQQGLHSRTGFTIVELLIVVVVIAILAAITIVSYNGITQSANESALRADLKNATTKLQLAKAGEDAYPESIDDYERADSTTFTYTRTGSGFCLEASSSSLPEKVFHATQQGGIEEGGCAVSAPTSMQAFTPAHCAALATNESKMLTDSRGGTERTYEIAKLADGKCWMLTNLKLGSTTGSITLMPSDSDVAANFTLPQLNDGTRVADSSTNPGNDYDSPYAYGPVPGEDITNPATKYGYLYNFAAATAGETRATLPAGTSSANYSICPAGWKLPSGGASAGVGDFSELHRAFADAAGGTGDDAGVPGWQPDGPFKGSYSGSWFGGFSNQGQVGYLWSSTADSGSAPFAIPMGFADGVAVASGGYIARAQALGVRCVLR